MNGLPYYKAYPRDFFEGTIGMAFETKGAYRLVVDLIYMQNGRLPDDPRYISGLLGCSIRKWNSIKNELVRLGKLHVSGKFLTNYRAVTELETLSKLQDKQRENRARPNKNKDLESPRSDHLRDYTEPEPKEKETPKGVPKKKAIRGTRLSKDWHASQAEFQYAAEHGLSESVIRIEEEKFRNYWLAKTGANATKLDWSATWRNWVLNAQRRMPRGSPANGNPDPNDHSLAAATQRIMNRRNTTNGQNAEASPGSGRRDFGNVELLPPVAQNEF